MQRGAKAESWGCRTPLGELQEGAGIYQVDRAGRQSSLACWGLYPGIVGCGWKLQGVRFDDSCWLSSRNENMRVAVGSTQPMLGSVFRVAGLGQGCWGEGILGPEGLFSGRDDNTCLHTFGGSVWGTVLPWGGKDSPHSLLLLDLWKGIFLPGQRVGMAGTVISSWTFCS